MKWRDTIWALAFALTLCVTGVRGQDQPQNSQSTSPVSPIPPLDSGGAGAYDKPPLAAARGVSTPYDPQPYDPANVTPDTNTLAGVEPFSVGSLGRARNVFDPSISYTELGQSVAQNGVVVPAMGAAIPMTLVPSSVFAGSLAFDRSWSQYHLTALFNGGDTLNSSPILPSGPFGNLIATQQMEWARWHVLLRDDFSAAPGALFTNAGMGGPGLVAQMSALLSASLTGIGTEFIPNDTIQTEKVLRYRNAALGQAEYSFSRRSTLTFSGSYGLLHFNDLEYISSRMLNVQAGYDYELDPSNSIAILAGYGKIDYTGAVNSTWDYTAALAYGRKITGRLAFQVAAGPQQIHSVQGAAGFQLWFLTANSALTYEFRRSGYTISFARGLGAGGGVFLGAKSNTVTGRAHYQFTRFWTGSVNGGYALSEGLEPDGTPATQFTNWFVGANIGRRLSPQFLVNFNYAVQRQNNPAVCPVANCGINGYQQTFGMTVNWHLRPAG